jgi:opacity protein-like surface antigen
MRGKRKTMTRHIRAFIAVSAMFAATSLSTAVYAFDWYGGASVGKNSYEVTPGDFFDTQQFSGVTDGNDGAWKAFVGMQLFEKYVSAEFGYSYLGKSSANGTISGAPASATSETAALTAALVGLIPMGTKFGALIRLGLDAAKSDITATKAGVSTREDTSNLQIFGGLGAQFDFSKTLSARLEYERYDLGSIGPKYANVLSVGFTYLFDTKK